MVLVEDGVSVVAAVLVVTTVGGIPHRVVRIAVLPVVLLQVEVIRVRGLQHLGQHAARAAPIAEAAHQEAQEPVQVL